MLIICETSSISLNLVSIKCGTTTFADRRHDSGKKGLRLKKMFRSLFCIVCGCFALGLMLGIVLVAIGPFQLQYAIMPRSMPCKDDVKPCVLKEHVRYSQRRLIDDLVTQLEQAGITYWATETTLLYAILFEDWTDFADNITFAVLKRDLPQLLQARNTLEQNGHAKLLHTTHGYTYCKNNVARYPCIDIRIMSECEGEIALCTPTNELAECTFEDAILRRREVFPKAMIFPLAQTKIGDRTIPTPAESEKCLQILFGLEWNTRLSFDALGLLRNRFTWQLIPF
jgi:hypothetical protein